MVPVARINFLRQKGSSYLRGRRNLFLSKDLCPQNHNVFILNEHKTCDKTAKLGCIISVGTPVKAYFKPNRHTHTCIN